MNSKVKVSVNARETLNYASSCAGQPIVSNVEVENTGEVRLENARLVLRAQENEIVHASFDLPPLEPKQKASLSCANVRANPRVIQLVTESYESAVHAEVFCGADPLGSASHTINVQPIDMWEGFQATVALASFCTPNHPALAKVCSRGAEMLREKHGSSSLSGYDNADPMWPRHQAAALFNALGEQKIAYAPPPNSFEHGQRIRLADRVLRERKGTCIDLAFAYASLLSSVRLSPIILMYDTHTFVGVRIKPEKAFNAICKSKEELRKLVEGEDPSILLVECTTLTHTSSNDFEAAVKAGTAKFAERPGFEYWLDIDAARARGSRPIPLFAEGSVESASSEGAGSLGEAEGDAESEGASATEPDANHEAQAESCLSAGEETSVDNARPSTRRPNDEVMAQLREHAGELGYNELTRALMGEPLKHAHCDIPEPSFIDPAGMLVPLAADASQLRAMQYVAEGGSCVLVGPPGAGKTQIIANVAANAVARGKTVLVAARNAEPLNVIADRMASACMSPFVLELQDKNASPSSALAQLELAATFDKADAEALLEARGLAHGERDGFDNPTSVVELSRNLDAYGTALSRKDETGRSLRDHICAYQAFRNASDMIVLGNEAIEALSSKQAFERMLTLIDDATDHVALMEGVQNHPLAHIGELDASETTSALHLQADMRAAKLLELKAGLDELDALASDEAPVVRIQEAAPPLLRDLAGICANPWLNQHVGLLIEQLAGKHCALAAQADEFALEVGGLWREGFFALSAEELAHDWAQARSAPLWQRRRAKEGILGKLQDHAWKSLSFDDVENAIGALEYHEERRHFASLSLLADAASISALLDEEIKACESIARAGDEINEWRRWLKLREEALELGLGSMVAALEAGEDAGEVALAAKKAVYQALCFKAIGGNQRLRGFSGASFERAIDRYVAADRDARARSARTLLESGLARTAETLTDARIADQVERFKRAVQSKGRGKTHRALLEAFPNVALGLCPCVLATPLTAARHLPWDMKFDLLIIDEASQIETLQAIGLLERARQVLVVGDQNQLPPASFFAVKANPAEFGIACRGESLLDECMISGLAQLMLRWHYRSRHESLIAFANRTFYRNRLLTFPSADDRISRVKLRRVEGAYDGRGRNEAEARAIVDELKRRFTEGFGGEKGCGIGVITSNVKQQALVNSLLGREFSQNPAFAHWARSGSESLFVRNLETVQGDERDLILLSITYGRDADGRLSLNFGPVNKAGGERRLNVAFTRARCEMLAFSTMTAGDIELTDAHSKGAHVMRDFLAYAEGACANEAPIGKPSGESCAIAKRLCVELGHRGYKTQPNVGASHAKVDVAVVDPHDERRYLAGILLDGKSYRMARSTRDRELGRIEQLRELGWNVLRLWSVDFLYDEQRCLERVIAFLEEAACQAKATH